MGTSCLDEQHPYTVFGHQSASSHAARASPTDHNVVIPHSKHAFVCHSVDAT